jgi:hypothetical protein
MTTKHLKILTLARRPACSAASTGVAMATPVVRFGQEKDGGARARAWAPVRKLGRSGALSDHATREDCRYGAAATVAWGVSMEAAAGATQQTAQAPSCSRCPPVGSIWPAAEAAPPEQIAAACSGSEAAMLAAQQAPIGARICTARAISTRGRNFRNRRRIKNHLFDIAN